MIKDITNSNPNIFLEKELEIRRKNNLPPFERFISLILSGRNKEKVEALGFKIKERLEKNLNLKILGPVSAPIFKINKNFRFRLLIRSKKSQKIQKQLSNILNNYTNSSKIKLVVDVDPISFN